MSILTVCIAGIMLFVGLLAAAIVHHKDERVKREAHEKTMRDADTITKRAQDLTKRFEEEKKSWK